jgi:hypothetical protein
MAEASRNYSGLKPEELTWSPDATITEIDQKLAEVSDHLVLACRSCGSSTWAVDISTGYGLGIHCDHCGVIPTGAIGEWLDYFRDWSAEDVTMADNMIRAMIGEPPRDGL